MSITINDLICMLEDAAEQSPEGEDTEVRFASQPSWPFEYSIDYRSHLQMEAHCEDCDGEGQDFDGERCGNCGGRGTTESDVAVFFLAEGRQLGYLEGDVKNALGW